MLSDEERMQIWDGFVQSGDTENIANEYAIAIERAVLARASQQVPEFNGWYCAQCQCGVDPSEVTYHETHTVCGRYITDDEPPKAMPETKQEKNWGDGGVIINSELFDTQPNFKKDGMQGMCSLERKSGGYAAYIGRFDNCAICGRTESNGFQCPRVTVPTYNDTGKPVLPETKQESVLIGHWDQDPRFNEIDYAEGILRGSFATGTPIYAYAAPPQAAAIPEAFSQNLELVIARLEQICDGRNIAEELASEALVCAKAIRLSAAPKPEGE